MYVFNKLNIYSINMLFLIITCVLLIKYTNKMTDTLCSLNLVDIRMGFQIQAIRIWFLMVLDNLRICIRFWQIHYLTNRDIRILSVSVPFPSLMPLNTMLICKWTCVINLWWVPMVALWGRPYPIFFMLPEMG